VNKFKNVQNSLGFLSFIILPTEEMRQQNKYK
jgi:hypothetical protein